MSTKIGKGDNSLALSAKTLIIEQNALNVLLLEAYDELTAKKGRGTWLTLTMTLLGAGCTGLLDWFIQDVLSAETLVEFAWICPQSLIYGICTVVSIISLLVYGISIPFAGKHNKQQFVKKYMNHKSLSVITQDFQLKSSISRTPSTKNAMLKSNDESKEDSASA